MSILLSGGGYISSHVSNLLLEEKRDIVIIDNFSNSTIEFVDILRSKGNLTFYEIDILDFNSMEKVFQNHVFHTVIHFAAFKSVEESNNNPLKYYENNIITLINVLKLMEKYSVKNFIFSSSATVYGIPESLPLTENSKLNTLNPYGRTKLFGEEICKDLAKTGKIKTICLRYFNPVGFVIPENSKHKTNLFPYIVSVIKGEKEKLLVYGGDYETPDKTAIRDYIHIQDLSEAHLAALKYISKMDKNFEVFNIGTGRGFSVLEVINEFKKITCKEIKYEITNRREGDAQEIYANCDKALNILGWKSSRTLTDMVKDSI